MGKIVTASSAVVLLLLCFGSHKSQGLHVVYKRLPTRGALGIQFPNVWSFPLVLLSNNRSSFHPFRPLRRILGLFFTQKTNCQIFGYFPFSILNFRVFASVHMRYYYGLGKEVPAVVLTQTHLKKRSVYAMQQVAVWFEYLGVVSESQLSDFSSLLDSGPLLFCALGTTNFHPTSKIVAKVTAAPIKHCGHLELCTRLGDGYDRTLNTTCTMFYSACCL